MKDYLINDHDIKMNAYVKRALDEYKKNHISLPQLVSHYAQSYLPCNEIEKAYNPMRDVTYLRVEKALSGMAVERGRTEAETAYEFAAMNIVAKKVKPSDFINQVFYSAKNDAQIECDILLRDAKECIHMNGFKKVLVAYPSPFMIKELIYLDNTNICFCVYDATIAKLFAYEYSKYQNITFCTKDVLIENNERFDLLILSYRKSGHSIEIPIRTESPIGFTKNEKVTYGDTYDFLSFSENAMMIVPEILVHYPAKMIKCAKREYKAKLVDICILPNILSFSQPRKKVLLKFLNDKADDSIVLSQIIYNHNDRIAHYRTERIINEQKLFEIKQTIRQAIISKNTSRIKNEYQIYNFSNEISIAYTTKNRNGYIVPRACYRCKIQNWERRQTGLRTSAYIEKGLRVKSAEELPEKLESVAYVESILIPAFSDMMKCLGNNWDEVSIKTIWYCLRYQYTDQFADFDDDAKTLFFTTMIGKSSFNELYKEELVELITNLSEESSVSPRDIWKILLTTYSVAYKYGYLTCLNPFSIYWVKAINSADIRYTQVRNALLVRNIELNDENKLIKQSLLQIENKQDVISMILLTRMFTGISTREACALIWKDISSVFENISALTIESFISNEARISYIETGSKERIRTLPIIPLLKTVYENHKQYIQNRYNVTDDEIALWPIFSDIGTKSKHSFLNIKKVDKELKKALSKLPRNAIDFSIPVEDGYKTLKTSNYCGDLLISNFRFHALHHAMFTNGELSYFLGKRAYDTFSEHYCDYSSVYGSIIMYKKLLRWDAMHNYNQLNLIKEKRELIINDEAYSCASTIEAIEAEIEIDSNEIVQLTINSNCGAEGIIVKEVE